MQANRRQNTLPISIILLFLFIYGCGSPPKEIRQTGGYNTFIDISKSGVSGLPAMDAWNEAVPGLRAVKINSSIDAGEQYALFYNSGSDKKKPLLLVLHSWSSNYLQYYSIPYGIWARENDWVFMHPDFRGPFTNSLAAASDYAISDILDSLDFAAEHARVDPERIYLSGFSGGGMTALVMAGLHPEIWAGVAVWGPVYDLAAWYFEVKDSHHDYPQHIRNICGGSPDPGTPYARECLRRSPVSHLNNARGRVNNVYIAAGIRDTFVPVGHSIRAFNDLAAESDRFSEEEIRYMENHRAIPPGLEGEYNDGAYNDAGRRLLYKRRSEGVTIKIYEGTHDIVYKAELEWLKQQKK